MRLICTMLTSLLVGLIATHDVAAKTDSSLRLPDNGELSSKTYCDLNGNVKFPASSKKGDAILEVSCVRSDSDGNIESLWFKTQLAHRISKGKFELPFNKAHLEASTKGKAVLVYTLNGETKRKPLPKSTDEGWSHSFEDYLELLIVELGQ